jgi:hypothetical protein
VHLKRGEAISFPEYQVLVEAALAEARE